MPGDMIVVAEKEDRWNDWGDVDPFAPDTGGEEWDPSKEPAVVEDADVWISDRGGDIDPFGSVGAGGGAALPPFRNDISGRSLPPVPLTGSIEVQADASKANPAFEQFEKTLKAKGDAIAAYRAIRTPGPQPPAFYVNAARLLFAHGHDTLGMQVLSNFVETPELDLGRVLANVLWLTEFDRDTNALTLLQYPRRLLPNEVLTEYHRAVIDARRGETSGLARDLRKVAEDGEVNQGVIALTDLNGFSARGEVPRPSGLPQFLTGNLDADIRIVVLGSDPDHRPGLTVAEPTGEVCRYESSCGGRIERASGITEYMMRRAMPGRYTINCRAAAPMTVRAIFYRNWGRPNQTSKTVTMLLPGNNRTTTLADYEFAFGE
jgi:hypothetical protein